MAVVKDDMCAQYIVHQAVGCGDDGVVAEVTSGVVHVEVVPVVGIFWNFVPHDDIKMPGQGEPHEDVVERGTGSLVDLQKDHVMFFFGFLGNH